MESAAGSVGTRRQRVRLETQPPRLEIRLPGARQCLTPGLSRPNPQLAGRLERVPQRLHPLFLLAEHSTADRGVQLHGVAQRPQGTEQMSVDPVVSGISRGEKYLVLGRLTVFAVGRLSIV